MSALRRRFVGALALAALSAAALGAPVADLTTWSAPSGDEAWSAKRLTGLEVRDADDETIGEVRDVIVDADERASALALELGGVLDAGAARVRLPWADIESVDAIGSLQYVVVPASDADLEGLGEPEVRLRGREWRTSDLIGDTVVLVDSPAGERGTVDDVLFGPDGRLEAVVASGVPGTDGEQAEYPFFGYDFGFEPALDRYILPYGVEDLSVGASGEDTLAIVSEPVKVATIAGAEGETDTASADAGGGAPVRASLDAEALFAFDSAELELGAEQAVTDLLVTLEEVPNIRRVEVVGHTDAIGPESYNQELSRARAEAVAELVRADLPDVEVVARGAGESEPQASNDTPEGRQLNRRVDVTAFPG